MLRRFVLVAALLLAVAPAAWAEPPTWGLTSSGDPRLSAAETGWWQRPPADQCRWISRETIVEPGPTARGTFFETGAEGWPDDVFRSPIWLGRVTARNHSRLTGSLRSGQSLRP